MAFNDSTKILLGILTICPVAYMCLFFVGMVSMMLLMPFDAGAPPSQEFGSPLSPIGFLSLFAVHMLMALLSMGLIAFYIFRVFKTPLEEATKIVWTVLICMFGAFAMPVFWYLHIWREPTVVPPGIAELGSAPTSAFVNSTQSSSRQNEYYPPQPVDWR